MLTIIVETFFPPNSFDTELKMIEKIFFEEENNRPRRENRSEGDQMKNEQTRGSFVTFLSLVSRIRTAQKRRGLLSHFALSDALKKSLSPDLYRSQSGGKTDYSVRVFRLK